MNWLKQFEFNLWEMHISLAFNWQESTISARCHQVRTRVGMINVLMMMTGLVMRSVAMLVGSTCCCRFEMKEMIFILSV